MSKTKAQISMCICSRQFSFEIEIKHFLIVNASKSQSPGTHWLLICKKATIFCLLILLDDSCLLTRIFINDLQKIMYSFNIYLKTNQFKVRLELVGLFCIFIAHLIFDNRQIVNCSDFQLIRFALHVML